MQFTSAILNREFVLDPNGWIEVLREGEFPHSSGIVQVVDRPALDAIVASFKRDQQQPNFPGLLVDRDHFSADADKPSEAMGWLIELRREGGSLMARVDWSATGEQAARSGSYRLLSPVFRPEDMEDLGGGRRRPLRLDSLGLTNAPNMRGLKPISNRSPGGDDLTPGEIDNLSPLQAGTRFSAICNRLKKEKGWSYALAWGHLQRAEPALYNRMAMQDRQPAGAVAGQEFTKFAVDALGALAEQERSASGRSFAESYQRVCNRRLDLVRLANRTLPPSTWDDMERKAFDAFAPGLDPDGRRLSVSNPEKLVKAFEYSYNETLRDCPGLTPRDIFEKITLSANSD